MKKLLLILLCLPLIGFGQNVYIPDANFKAYLVGNTLINTNGDSEIQGSEANSFNGSINCNNMSIADLTGIEAFISLDRLSVHYNNLSTLDISNNVALTVLNFQQNQLTALNVSQNIALTELNCCSNQLTSLDVSNNTALTYLQCGDNGLTSIDVSGATALTDLGCGANQLTSLDVSNNTALTQLHCYNNQLTSLDLRNGNNTNFIIIFAEGNTNLNCINVDDFQYSLFNWNSFAYFKFDTQHYFSNNCSGTSVEEHTTKKELLKVTDLLGREAKGTKNEVLLYIYDDGTVEKRIVIE